MDADSLALWVARTSAAMVVTVQDKGALVIHGQLKNMQ